MFDIFGNIKSLLKIQTVCIDNNIFRLHYQVTLIILVLFSIIVNSRQYFGDPIDCTDDASESVTRVIDNYCWMHIYRPAGVYEEQKINGGSTLVQKDEVPLTYYQWVGFALFFQAILFFIPRYLWKYCWEEGKIKGLAGGLKGPTIDQDNESLRKKLILDYLQKNIRNHNIYYIRYMVCEVMNLLNVILQMFFMDKFLGYEFSTYGSQVLDFVSNKIPEERKDPMNDVFPKVAQCVFKRFGVQGSIKPHYSLCVLPVNIFNEKIYVFLWFWFILLITLTCMGLCYRAITFIPQVRAYILHRRTKSVKLIVTQDITRNIAVGDWFLLYQIGKNMDPLLFGELLKEFGNRCVGYQYNELDALKP